MVEDGVRNGHLAAYLVLQRLLSLVLPVLPLVDDVVPIDVTTLVRDALTLEDVHVDDIGLMEVLCPAFRDSVLHLILDHVLVGALGEGLSQ